jgi:hypothetical protein
MNFFQKDEDRLKLGVEGVYPDHLIESIRGKSESRHAVNEALTRPWIRHYFIMQIMRDTKSQDEAVVRDNNLIDLLKTTIPLAENSFAESAMSSWQMFLGSAFRDADAPWYSGIRKVLVHDRFYTAIEQLELEVPAANPQHALQFSDHTRTLRRIPRVPIKLLIALAGNEKERLTELLRQGVMNNPHSTDVALLAYSFFKAWNRSREFLELARHEGRTELVEWYYWIEGDMKSLGALRREAGDHASSFYIYDRANLTVPECKELADWFLKESEFKYAYHFYYKAKEFETAIELLQNISPKEFGELMNLRRISKGEKIIENGVDGSRLAGMYEEEIETLRGFARIRAAETFKQVAVKARQHFDRETIETKYAFGELSEDEYTRLIHQLAERKQ